MDAMNSARRYGSVAIAFHWVIAALIATNLGLGFYFANVMDHNAPGFFTVVQTHKSIGLTVLVLSVMRLAWRLVNPIPPLPTDFGIGMRVLARGTHYLFYFLILAVPFLGWMLVSTSPRGTPTFYFGSFQWPQLPILSTLPRPEKRYYVQLIASAHAIAAYSALGLLLLHASAALWHHFKRRDPILKRMLPGTNVPAA